MIPRQDSGRQPPYSRRVRKDPIADTQPLFEALYESEDAVVRLLRAGLPAEAVDEDGATPLYLASVSDRPGVVRLLLAAGADPDRACGPESGDLPLCGAACGGHTEVVEALLSAGARPDLREQFGFTALRWAVGLGHARTAEALLAHGADPDLPGPEGEPPLVLAARRGSLETVRALLRYGAGARAEALTEARRMLTADLERDLRDTLHEAFGEDGPGPSGHRTVVHRSVVDGGETLTVELVRNGEPFAGRDQQTGHGAIATVLENELGLAAPYEELAARALHGGGPGLDNWQVTVETAARRGDEETFRSATAWLAGADPRRRAWTAAVLAHPARSDPSPGPDPSGD